MAPANRRQVWESYLVSGNGTRIGSRDPLDAVVLSGWTGRQEDVSYVPVGRRWVGALASFTWLTKNRRRECIPG